MYVPGSVMIFNFLKYGLQLVETAILAVNLIALFCYLKFFKVCRVSPK